MPQARSDDASPLADERSGRSGDAGRRGAPADFAIYVFARFLLIFALLLPLPGLAAPVHIVAFGDSATSGWLVRRDQAYPAQLQRMLRTKGYDVTVKNAGVPGDTTSGALKRLDLAIDPGTGVALVEFGTNDLRLHVPRARMEKNLAAIVHTLKQRKIAVLLIGLGSLDLSKIAREANVPYAQWKLPRHQYRARDGAHFNADGYRIVLERTLPQIEALVGAVRTRQWQGPGAAR